MASSASVYSKKISGEAHQFTAEAGETIGALKVGLPSPEFYLEWVSICFYGFIIKCIAGFTFEFVAARRGNSFQAGLCCIF